MTPINTLAFEDKEGRFLYSKDSKIDGNISKEFLGIIDSWEAFCFSYILNLAIK
jgi:hypothetical protein